MVADTSMCRVKAKCDVAGGRLDARRRSHCVRIWLMAGCRRIKRISLQNVRRPGVAFCRPERDDFASSIDIMRVGIRIMTCRIDTMMALDGTVHCNAVERKWTLPVYFRIVERPAAISIIHTTVAIAIIIPNTNHTAIKSSVPSFGGRTFASLSSIGCV